MTHSKFLNAKGWCKVQTACLKSQSSLSANLLCALRDPSLRYGEDTAV